MILTNAKAAAAVAVFFAGVGIACVAVGLGYQYYDLMGPGAGFFPIWIGVLLTALSVAVLVQGLRSAPAPGEAEADEPFFPSPAAAYRILGLLVALFVVCWLLDVLGFRLTIFVFALIGPRLIEPQPLVRSLVVALLCSFGVAYGFESWLQVQLPSPSIGVLDDLGF
jgi:putative tricarboxylic transport membrane protein